MSEIDSRFLTTAVFHVLNVFLPGDDRILFPGRIYSELDVHSLPFGLLLREFNRGAPGFVLFSLSFRGLCRRVEDDHGVSLNLGFLELLLFSFVVLHLFDFDCVYVSIRVCHHLWWGVVRQVFRFMDIPGVNSVPDGLCSGIRVFREVPGNGERLSYVYGCFILHISFCAYIRMFGNQYDFSLFSISANRN